MVIQSEKLEIGKTAKIFKSKFGSFLWNDGYWIEKEFKKKRKEKKRKQGQVNKATSASAKTLSSQRTVAWAFHKDMVKVFL